MQEVSPKRRNPFFFLRLSLQTNEEAKVESFLLL